MQVTHTKSHFKKHIYKYVKLSFSVVVLFFIGFQLRDQKLSISEIHIDGFLFTLVIVCLLGVVNWWLEAEKWRMAVPNEHLTRKESVRIVLIGQAINWLLPYATGDFLVRLKNVNNHFQSAKSAVIISFLSLAITMLFGGCSMAFYFDKIDTHQLLWLIGAFTLTLFFAFFIKVIHELGSVIWLTILRYFVFTFQFYLLIDLYVDLPTIQILMGIGWIFLFKTFSPGILGKIGVREASAMVFFEGLLGSTSIIMIPCTLIWLINAVTPSVIGALLISTQGSHKILPA
ncbi:MAG: hypothetical protein RIA69_07585 [Cyclobacteriaceae bacterium]